MLVRQATKTAVLHQPLHPDDVSRYAQRNNLPAWLVARGSLDEIARRRHPWTAANDQCLRQEIGLVPVAVLARRFDRRISQVDQRAILMGLPCQKIMFGRDDYSLPLAKYLLGVSGTQLRQWHKRGYLVTHIQNGEEFVSRGMLYRTLSIPEVRVAIDVLKIQDTRLRQVAGDLPRKRPADAPAIPFTSRERTLLARGKYLSIPAELMAGYLNRDTPQVVAQLSCLGVDDVGDATVDKTGEQVLVSWKRSRIKPLVQAVVRYDAGCPTNEDLVWVGRLFLTWMDFYQVPYPTFLRATRFSLSSLQVLYQKLCEKGHDPLYEAPASPVFTLDDTHPGKIEGHKTYRWLEYEDALFQEYWGIWPVDKLATECSLAHLRLTGDDQATRSYPALANRATQRKIDGREQWWFGLTIADACKWSGICRETVYQAAETGELETLRGAKYRYIPWDAWFEWRHNHHAYLHSKQQAWGTLPEETISKQEAMRLTGFCESHITRLLRGEILKGYKLPRGKLGEWRVSKEAALRIKAKRGLGRGQLDLSSQKYRNVAYGDDSRYRGGQ